MKALALAALLGGTFVGCTDELAVRPDTTPTFSVSFFEATPVASREVQRENLRAFMRASAALRAQTMQPATSLSELDAAVERVGARYGDGAELRFARAIAAQYALERLLLPDGLSAAEKGEAERLVGVLQDAGLVSPGVLAPTLAALRADMDPAAYARARAFARTAPPSTPAEMMTPTGNPAADLRLARERQSAHAAGEALREH